MSLARANDEDKERKLDEEDGGATICGFRWMGITWVISGYVSVGVTSRQRLSPMSWKVVTEGSAVYWTRHEWD